MQLAADFRSASTALLTIGSGPHGYAVPGACVMGIEYLRDWRGEPPLDALVLLGLATPAPADDDARVAVLDVGDRRLPLLVRGAVGLLQPAPDELLALPAVMRDARGLVSHIAVVDGKPTLYVLSPIRLARTQPEASTSAPAPIVSR